MSRIPRRLFKKINLKWFRQLERETGMHISVTRTREGFYMLRVQP